jgi:hypothetical protein
MRRLAEVEDAKALMTEATSWSVVKWLREKKKVRKAADKANAVLDRLNKETKDAWSDDLRQAYTALAAGPANPRGRHAEAKPSPLNIDPQVISFLKRIKEADDEAYRARMDAEDTFDEAEKELSTSMAREGCRKAILSWELHEKAIRKAEAGMRGDSDRSLTGGH